MKKLTKRQKFAKFYDSNLRTFFTFGNLKTRKIPIIPHVTILAHLKNAKYVLKTSRINICLIMSEFV